ncbi:HD-GYP domain-containing protein [Acidicapsa dinghuensis]|uniref:HD-GYP domain-containing protein n=1 Tax=Acidicapsa dinghuensis TaxID=2218256 RepID=A0ABW1EK65_9BACT|nr:HD domain-containing phosphohydrolase [Acidicapsa dinghuensis]
MIGTHQIPMHEMLAALSYALDLTEGAIPGHAIRSCLYGMRIADELGLPELDRTTLYYALLLKDVGCSGNAARMYSLIGGDDRRMKHDVRLLDWTRPSLAAFSTLWHQALPGSSAILRTGRVLKLALDQNKNSRTMIAIRAELGANIARKIGLGEGVAETILRLNEHWDGSGYPQGQRGQTIPLLSRIAAVAQHLDIFASETGLSRAMQELTDRAGRWFDPELVRVARCLYSRSQLRAAVGGFDHFARVKQLRPGTLRSLSTEEVDRICEIFAEVIDAKSSFTRSHSSSTARIAVGIAGELGFTVQRRNRIRRAALLHDIGKLSLPNTILDKTGPLSPDEWDAVRAHPILSRQILDRIPHFGEIPAIAAQHHEKLDGGGYPFGLSGRDLSLDSRIVALADIFAALSEKRPYRKTLEIGEVINILESDVPNKLDPDCFEALLRYLHSAPYATI